MLILQTALLALIAITSVFIVIQDAKTTYVDKRLVIINSLSMIITGYLLPISSTNIFETFTTMLAAAMIAVICRLWVHYRTGHYALGGADIAIIIGGGAIFGPTYFSIWLIMAIFIALILGFIDILPMKARTVELDGKQISAIPFCPSLLAAGFILWPIAQFSHLTSN